MMLRAKDLVSERVVVGMAEERLINVAARIRQRRAYCCAVLSTPGRFLGLITLKELASLSNPGNRILADLIDQAPTVFVAFDEPLSVLLERFSGQELDAVVVLRPDQSYLGVITAETVFRGAWNEMRNARNGAT